MFLDSLGAYGCLFGNPGINKDERLTDAFYIQWTVHDTLGDEDVAGIIERKDLNPEIVGVEAKNDLGPQTVLQAISQAEMYQKVCSRSYMALPSDEIDRLRKQAIEDWMQIVNLCKSKGIGILSVGDEDCNELEKPLGIDHIQINKIYEDMIEQFDRLLTTRFKGFDDKDHEYFLGHNDGRKFLVKRKIELLLQEVKSTMLARCTALPYIDPRKLQVEIGSFSGYHCWCYISQESRKSLPYHTHFTLNIDKSGLDLVLNMETKTPVIKFRDRISKEPNVFIKAIDDLSEEVELMVWEQIPQKGKPYRYQWIWWKICAFPKLYIDKKVVDFIIDKLNSLPYTIVRFGYSPQLYDWTNPEMNSEELVSGIFSIIEEFQEIYNFAHI